MKEKNKYAPVAIFCYNRLDKLKQLLDSLKQNKEISNTKVYFFVDLYEADISISEEIAVYLQGINYFGEKEIVLREKNYGLKKNIEDGIDFIFKLEDRIICLEDDLRVDKYFLSYMNLCLNNYAFNQDIWHINAWSYPQFRFLNSDIFVGNLVNVWGWGTWKDCWLKHVERKEDNISKLDADYTKRFNFYNLNKNFQQQLLDNKMNKINTWAIYWYQTIFLNQGKTIYPKHSLVINNGFDGSGVNSGKTNHYKSKLKNKKIQSFPKNLNIDKLNIFYTIIFYTRIYVLNKYIYYKNKFKY